MNLQESARLLATHDDFLIITHKNPDGDTVMSAAALCRALRRKNKRAWLYPNPQITRKMLPFVEKLFAPETFHPRFTVCVDISVENLFPEGFNGKTDFCIDHHPTNSGYTMHRLVDPERSSCGEIVLELILELTGKITKTEATLLYIALTTDTGAFQYANVSEKSFQSAATMLKYGADANSVMLHFFRKTSEQRLRLEGAIYSNMRFYREAGWSLPQ